MFRLRFATLVSGLVLVVESEWTEVTSTLLIRPMKCLFFFRFLLKIEYAEMLMVHAKLFIFIIFKFVIIFFVYRPASV